MGWLRGAVFLLLLAGAFAAASTDVEKQEDEVVVVVVPHLVEVRWMGSTASRALLLLPYLDALSSSSSWLPTPLSHVRQMLTYRVSPAIWPLPPVEEDNDEQFDRAVFDSLHQQDDSGVFVVYVLAEGTSSTGDHLAASSSRGRYAWITSPSAATSLLPQLASVIHRASLHLVASTPVVHSSSLIDISPSRPRRKVKLVDAADGGSVAATTLLHTLGQFPALDVTTTHTPECDAIARDYTALKDNKTDLTARVRQVAHSVDDDEFVILITASATPPASSLLLDSSTLLVLASSSSDKPPFPYLAQALRGLFAMRPTYERYSSTDHHLVSRGGNDPFSPHYRPSSRYNLSTAVLDAAWRNPIVLHLEESLYRLAATVAAANAAPRSKARAEAQRAAWWLARYNRKLAVSKALSCRRLVELAEEEDASAIRGRLNTNHTTTRGDDHHYGLELFSSLLLALVLAMVYEAKLSQLKFNAMAATTSSSAAVAAASAASSASFSPTNTTTATTTTLLVSSPLPSHRGGGTGRAGRDFVTPTKKRS